MLLDGLDPLLDFGLKFLGEILEHLLDVWLTLEVQWRVRNNLLDGGISLFRIRVHRLFLWSLLCEILAVCALVVRLLDSLTDGSLQEHLRVHQVVGLPEFALFKRGGWNQIFVCTLIAHFVPLIHVDSRRRRVGALLHGPDVVHEDATLVRGAALAQAHGLPRLLLARRRVAGIGQLLRNQFGLIDGGLGFAHDVFLFYLIQYQKCLLSMYYINMQSKNIQGEPLFIESVS